MAGETRNPDVDIWHVAIPVADLSRTFDFYCSRLGFKLVGRDEYPSKRQLFVAVREGGFTIEFFEPKGVSMAPGAGRPDHLAFECADLESIRARILKAGMAVPEIEIFDNGVKFFGLRDPEGLRLEFFEGRHLYEKQISTPSPGLPRE